MELVRKIQSGQLSQAKASSLYKVTRYTIRTWVNDYAMFNLDGSIAHQVLNNMPSDERKEELLEQMKKLNEQVQDDKLNLLYFII